MQAQCKEFMRERDMAWQQQYIARFYGPDRGWVDGTTEFHALRKAAIPKVRGF